MFIYTPNVLRFDNPLLKYFTHKKFT